MHKARAFFYVCAGLFLLALSYHLGARSAGAQAPAIEASSAEGGGYTVAFGRTVYRIAIGGATEVITGVPGTDPIVAVGWGGGTPGGYAYVGLANGDYFYRACSGCAPSGWQHIGNVFGGVAPAQRESFGAMKSRYRGERGAAQPTQDR